MIGYVRLAGDLLQCYDHLLFKNALPVQHCLDSTIRLRVLCYHRDRSVAYSGVEITRG